MFDNLEINAREPERDLLDMLEVGTAIVLVNEC